MNKLFYIVMRIISSLLGLLLVAVGGIWVLQGTGLAFKVGFMVGDWHWAPWRGTRLNASVFMAVLAVPAAWCFMRKSFAGYRMEVGGLAPLAARYAGYSEPRAVWLALLIGGAAAGLAGTGEVAGPVGQLQATWAPGYGFTAIIVAFVGRLHPVGIVLASLLMALLYLGGEAVQTSLQLPKAISGVFQGLLLFSLLGCDVFVTYRLRRRVRAQASEA